MKKIAITACVLVALLSTTAVAQISGGAFDLAKYVPPGSLVYSEIDDLAARLGSILDSPWREKFAQSKAYKDFTVSKLYNKLADRIKALEESTGFGLSLDNVRALAGGRSAIALYDIGELQFLFISELSMEKLAASALWNLRDKFESRGEGEARYWVKEDAYGRVALAFTFAGNRLLVGTDVVRFEQAMELLSKDGNNLVNDERFASALPADIPETDIFVYLDLERIATTPYWRSYWIFGNQADLADMKSVILALNIDDDEIIETRWLRRDILPQQATGLAELASRMPGSALYYEYGTADDELTRNMLGSLFGGAENEALDNLAASFHQGFSRTYGLAANISNSTAPFGTGFTTVLAFDGANSTGFDTVQFEKTVSEVYSSRLLPKGIATLKFVDRDGSRVLDLPLFEGEAPAYRVDGSIVFISNSASALMAETGSAPNLVENLAAQSGTTMAALLDTKAMKEKLEDFFALLSKKDGWRPNYNSTFFGENITSLMMLFENLESMSLLRSVNDGIVVEKVSYKLAQ